jgi:signal transduction histidine kinase
VEDVLKYCRRPGSRDSVPQEPIEKIIQQVVSLLDPRFREKSIQVSFGPESCDALFVTDEAAMIQVLMNILINAVDAVEKDGRILIDLEAQENGCLIRVSDNGPGIDESLAEDVFQSFVTFKDGGTGLGLYISKRIVESLGGKINVETSSLGGAAFSIFLPQKNLTPHESISYV